MNFNSELDTRVPSRVRAAEGRARATRPDLVFFFRSSVLPFVLQKNVCICINGIDGRKEKKNLTCEQRRELLGKKLLDKIIICYRFGGAIR